MMKLVPLVANPGFPFVSCAMTFTRARVVTGAAAHVYEPLFASPLTLAVEYVRPLSSENSRSTLETPADAAPRPGIRSAHPRQPS